MVSLSRTLNSPKLVKFCTGLRFVTLEWYRNEKYKYEPPQCNTLDSTHVSTKLAILIKENFFFGKGRSESLLTIS